MDNEKNKNGAIDKMNAIMNEPQVIPSVEIPTVEAQTAAQTVTRNSGVKKSSKKQTRTPSKNGKKPTVSKKQREENAKKKLEEKASREEAKRLRKAEKIKLAENKKRERVKKAAAKKQAKKRKVESVKAMKIQKREERLARRERLKNETKTQRQKRIAAERQERLKVKADAKKRADELKRQKHERVAELKRDKMQKREERKRLKAERAAERREKNAVRREKSDSEKRKRGIGGWLAAVISLGCSVLILGSLLTFTLFSGDIGSHPAADASANTARNFYDFVGYVDGLETNMAKLFVSTDEHGQQRLLGDIMVQANLADSALAELPINDESKFYTSKYVNQVGDYAKYLNNRLIDGCGLTQEDYATLKNLYDVNVGLKSALSTLSASIGENYDFATLADNNSSDVIIAQFDEFEKSTVEYPQMIYDGAFSDGLDAIKPRGVHGERVDEITVKEKVGKQFASYGVKDVEVTGLTENTKFNCFVVTAKTEDGRDFSAQYTVEGGRLLNFTAHGDCTGEAITEDEAENSALTFLNDLGFDSMKRVWRYSVGGVEYLNYVVTDGVTVVYPDMIKLTVCRQTGKVTGFDAEEYYLNHVERGEFEAKYSIKQALKKVDAKMDVNYSGKAIVPVGNGKETCAYEFVGSADGQEYYVYIDANTLSEIKIYKVVSTEQGKLLV